MTMEEEKKPTKRRVSWKRSAIECEKELNKVKDQLLRTAAEFQNYKKRVEQEKKALLEQGKAMALKDLLHVFDMLDMALAAAEKSSSIEDLVQGLKMIQTQWSSILENEGVKEVPGEGHPFDPSVHDAIQVLDTEDYPPGTVTKVLRKGFKLKDKVLRPAQVVVSQNPEKEVKKEEEEVKRKEGEIEEEKEKEKEEEEKTKEE